MPRLTPERECEIRWSLANLGPFGSGPALEDLLDEVDALRVDLVALRGNNQIRTMLYEDLIRAVEWREVAIAQDRAKTGALETEIAHYKKFLAAIGEMESFRDTLPKESPHE